MWTIHNLLDNDYLSSYYTKLAENVKFFLGSDVIYKILFAIISGEAFPDEKHPDRMCIAYKGKIAIITFDLQGIETTALLTAFLT